MDKHYTLKDDRSEIQKIKELRDYIYRIANLTVTAIGTPVMFANSIGAIEKCAQTHLNISIIEKQVCGRWDDE